MSAVAEGRIRRHLAVAQFEVTRLLHVELHWSATSHHPLALTVAERGHLSVATSAPVIDLSSLQVEVSGEETSEDWHGRRSVLAFFVGSAFREINYFLQGEICRVFHRDLRSGLTGLRIRSSDYFKDEWFWHETVTVVSFELTSSGTKGE